MRYENNAACDVNVNRLVPKEQAPRGPFTSELRDRIDRLYSVLGASEENLTSLRSEKMGPWPIGDGAGGPGNPPQAEFEDILSRLDTVIARADSVAWHSQVLRDSI